MPLGPPLSVPAGVGFRALSVEYCIPEDSVSVSVEPSTLSSSSIRGELVWWVSLRSSMMRGSLVAVVFLDVGGCLFMPVVPSSSSASSGCWFGLLANVGLFDSSRRRLFRRGPLAEVTATLCSVGWVGFLSVLVGSVGGVVSVLVGGVGGFVIAGVLVRVISSWIHSSSCWF